MALFGIDFVLVMAMGYHVGWRGGEILGGIDLGIGFLELYLLNLRD